MLVENLLEVPFPPEKAAEWALERGARGPYGTDMEKLLELASAEWGFKVEKKELFSAPVFKKSAVIINVSGDISEKKGIFSTGGHYVMAIFSLGETVAVLDPYLYSGKYSGTYRRAFARERDGIVYTTAEALSLDSRGRTPPFYEVTALG